MTAVTRPEPRTLLTGVSRKQQAVAAVIAGQLSLLEAAACFRAAAADRSDSPEGWCRAVIGWVDLALRDRPERAEELSARLERELERHLGGPARLLPTN